GSDAASTYRPGWTLANVNRPLALVTAWNFICVTSSSVTWTPGITAPVASYTAPDNDVGWACRARTAAAGSVTASSRAAVTRAPRRVSGRRSSCGLSMSAILLSNVDGRAIGTADAQCQPAV